MSSRTKLLLMNSVMGNALMGPNSIYSPQGYTAIAPAVRDTTNAIQQSNGVVSPAFNSTVRFNIDKNSTLVMDAMLEFKITPGTTSPASTIADPTVAYVRNAGDLIGAQHQLIYGNTSLQTWEGRFSALYRTLCKKDIDIEDINAQVLGGLPPGGALPSTGPEPVLIDAFYNGVTLYTPLDELFFVHGDDQAWMPEAYALEAQLQTRIAPLEELLVTRSRTASEVTGAGAVPPTIESCLLRYTSVTISAAEKNNRLKLYRTPEGLVQRCYTIEAQTQGLRVTGSADRAPNFPLSARPLIRSQRLLLGNLRMDIALMVIAVHRVANGYPAADFPFENAVLGAPYNASYLEDDNSTPSLLAPADGGNYSTLVEVEAMQLYSGQKALYAQDMPGFWNRTRVRRLYFPKKGSAAGSQYHWSFARYPEDRRNCTGHLSASVAGQLGIEIVVRDPGPLITYAPSVYAQCYNFAQSRSGGVSMAFDA